MNNSGRKVVKLLVAGKLYAGGKEYYLLLPEPVAKDSWQPDNVLRFFAVRCVNLKSDPLNYVVVGEKSVVVYDSPSHILVSGTWHIDLSFSGTEIYVYEYLVEEYQDSAPKLDENYAVTDPENGKVYKFSALEPVGLPI